MDSASFPLHPIGHIVTPFKQKFAIPRQPSLTNARGQIILSPGFDDPRVFKGIEVYSHVWLLFIFHHTLDKGWKPTVKAPRLGGNASLGVYASRSTHRPNSIGMSAVKNLGYETIDDQLVLHVEGVDLLNGTPIVDIKPYLPYSDAPIDATDSLDTLAHYTPIPQKEVVVEASAQVSLQQAQEHHADLPQLIVSVLAQDPRPAYRHKLENDDKTYSTMLYHYDVSFKVQHGKVHVVAINSC